MDDNCVSIYFEKKTVIFQSLKKEEKNNPFFILEQTHFLSQIRDKV